MHLEELSFMTQDVRLEQLTQWVNSLPGWEHALLESASADASFRRYFRARGTEGTAICMDVPIKQISLWTLPLPSWKEVHVPQLLA